MRALFLDRDGTLIPDVGYPRDPNLVSLLPDAARVLREASGLGYVLVVVSNQSGVARGLIAPDEARAVQARVEELFAAEGVFFARSAFCFHGPDDACGCRKPAPGMLLDAARDLGLDLGSSVMIGDKPSDVGAGIAAGCTALTFGDVPHPNAAASFSTWEALGAWLRAKS